MSEESFYMPDPDLFGKADAYALYTAYATNLEDAGLASQFPAESELRRIAIELLAERYAIEELEKHPSLIDDAVTEAHGILDERREGKGRRGPSATR